MTEMPSWFEDVVVLLRLVEGERVLEAGAAASAHGDAKRLFFGVLVRHGELADLRKR